MTSTEEVQVDVKHRLPCVLAAVHHHAIAVFMKMMFARQRRSADDDFPNHCIIGGRELVGARDVATRNHQKMRRSLRVDVFERHHVFVFEYFSSRNLVCDDLAEETTIGGR